MGRSLHSEEYKHLLARLREARRQVELTQARGRTPAAASSIVRFKV